LVKVVLISSNFFNVNLTTKIKKKDFKIKITKKMNKKININRALFEKTTLFKKKFTILRSRFFKDNIKFSLLKKILTIGIKEVRLNTSNKEFMNKKKTNIKILF
jgi:hypothetical protein